MYHLSRFVIRLIRSGCSCIFICGEGCGKGFYANDKYNYFKYVGGYKHFITNYNDNAFSPNRSETVHIYHGSIFKVIPNLIGVTREGNFITFITRKNIIDYYYESGAGSYICSKTDPLYYTYRYVRYCAILYAFKQVCKNFY